MDLDIYFISPKIIIHETLLNEKLMDRTNADAIIIDLGTIETVTKLIKKEKGFDYNSAESEDKLYDTTTVKFGDLKIVFDYNMIFQNQGFSDKHLSWSLSKEIVRVTNEFNFGFELKTCLTPFHHAYPSQIINLMIHELQLNVSKKVTGTIFKLQNLIL